VRNKKVDDGHAFVRRINMRSHQSGRMDDCMTLFIVAVVVQVNK